jgi:hypothetical protein
VSVPAPAARSPRQRFVITAALIGLCTLVLVVILSAAGVAPWDHGAAAPHTVSVPLGDRQRAQLALLSGAASITVATAARPGPLIRVSTPDAAGSVPVLAVSGGTIQLTLRDSGTGGGGPAAVAVTLTAPAGVPAQLALDGGASTATLAGQTTTGIAGGTVLTAPGWAGAVNRYDIEAPAGVSDISFGAW